MQSFLLIAFVSFLAKVLNLERFHCKNLLALQTIAPIAHHFSITISPYVDAYIIYSFTGCCRVPQLLFRSRIMRTI